MTYPRWNPASKHDIKSPRLPPPGTALQDSLTYLDSALKLFQTLQEDSHEAPQHLKPLATVYSYKEDAPTQHPLSRDLCIIGVAPMSLGVVRKLLTEDDHEPQERVATDACLHKCTVAVRRGDGKYLAQLDQKHVLNSKSFAKLMQRLREENLVAILGLDKYGRFGILHPIDQNHNNDGSSAHYHEHDFYGSCFVGKVDDVKDFLRQGMTSSTSSSTNNEPASAPSSYAQENTDEPMYRPPDEEDDDDGLPYQPADDSGAGLWQPPGSSGDDNNANGDDAFSWQPPTNNTDNNNTDGGGDSFSWQPSSTADGGDFGGGDTNTFSWNGGSNDDGTQAEHSNKRKRDNDDGDENNDANGDNFHANKGAAAADAFYSGLTRTLDTRWQSRIYHMRSFNGWVKATQIQDLNPYTKTSGKNGPLRVLDLACGKGGDLGKVSYNRSEYSRMRWFAILSLYGRT